MHNLELMHSFSCFSSTKVHDVKGTIGIAAQKDVLHNKHLKFHGIAK